MKCPHCSKDIAITLSKASGGAPPAATSSKAPEELGELLDAISDDMLVDGQEADFVADIRERFKKYKSRTLISEKQLAWLRKIADPEAERF